MGLEQSDVGLKQSDIGLLQSEELKMRKSEENRENDTNCLNPTIKRTKNHTTTG